MFDLPIEKAKILKQKTEDFKTKLNQEFITHSSSDKSIEIKISILGNIKEINTTASVDITHIIPLLNEAINEAKSIYEIRLAEMYQQEMKNLWNG
ncbi:hypothetical protein CQ046_02850 [Chryseobacterium sp. MYb7]|uniref:hypothetical protein n=1 Tax=Chryseobacterium sp. MYb7 TaxID=1827290 RepID=UPI000CFF3061|nr:hypothetical protein [Chryseobacterium sp. MYb7]PRB06126.1 hypothetical protein CQ046_02850 [Chryseobacterium sp. MYb7]